MDSDPSKKFEYKFDDGSVIVLEAEFTKGKGHVVAFGPPRFSVVGSEPLKKPISKKAKQHKSLRHKGIPYVIAIFLEDSMYDEDDIVKALFGNFQVTINLERNEIVGQKFDRTGIHFFGENILHTTVSGLLVFKRNLSEVGFQLQSCYIENPFAIVSIKPNAFPVDKRWVERSRNGNGIEMGWEE